MPNLLSFFKQYGSYMLSVLLIVELTACHTDTVYHVYHPVSENGWSKQDTLTYTLPDSLETGYYQLEVDIRHTEAYPYRDIWLELAFERRKSQSTFTVPSKLEDSLDINEPYIPTDSMVWVRDTLHLYLTDEQGRWLKGGTIGSLYQFSAPARPFCLNDKDGKNFRIIHIMKDNPLHGIHDIGLRLFQPASQTE